MRIPVYSRSLDITVRLTTFRLEILPLSTYALWERSSSRSYQLMYFAYTQLPFISSFLGLCVSVQACPKVMMLFFL